MPLTKGAGAYYVAWSPDGQRLAYIGQSIACQGFPHIIDLVAGTDRTVLTGVFPLQQRPGFSADGQRVYAVSTQESSGAGGLLDVAVGADAAGGSISRIELPPSYGGRGGTSPTLYRTVVASRSGTLAAWSLAPTPAQLALVRPDGTVLLRRAGVGLPAWHPIANQIAFHDSGRGLLLFDADSGVEKVLDPAGGTLPAWSPEGKKLAYVRLAGDTASLPAVFVVDVTTGAITQPVREPAWFPTWSPDGRWIAYTRVARSPGGGPFPISQGISMVHPDGSGLIQLTPDDGSDAPVFAPS